MNCSNCGLQISTDQQFCRSCGTELWADERGSSFPLSIIGLMLAFGGIIIALTARMLLQHDIFVFIGVIISVTGMFSIAAIPMISAMRTGKKHTRKAADKTAVLAPAESTMKLPPMNGFEGIPSVVDNTTQLLKEPVQKHPTARR